MAFLFYPNKIENYEEIVSFLETRGIHYEKWLLGKDLDVSATDADILKAYEEHVKPFCEKKGYKTFDIINVNTQTPNLEQLKQKFLKEHTHSEDEVRFFVYGRGLFWFNVNGEVFSMLCEEGDLLSVPALSKHWFDMGDAPQLKVIRMFTDPQGWVANYTESSVDANYNQLFNW